MKTKYLVGCFFSLGALALAPINAGGQTQIQDNPKKIRVFSPSHVTADNPQGIVTGGYKGPDLKYENADFNLKSSQAGFYGDQVLNPFIRPGYRDKNLGLRDYYGSKDVNGNHVINEIADVEAIESGDSSYRGDVNGDGITNLIDAELIRGVINQTIPYAPSDWNYLNKEERIEYFEKLVKIDDTDAYRKDWSCGEYSDALWLRFAGLEKAEGDPNYSSYSDLVYLQKENGLYNLPVYKAATKTNSGIEHFINAILVGDDPRNFDDWYFIEPQTDQRVKPGDFSMRNAEGEGADIFRTVYVKQKSTGKFVYGEISIIAFSFHNRDPPTLYWNAKDLITSKPENPVSGIKETVNGLENKLNVFPNPVVKGYELNIVNTSGQFDKNGELEIYDISGKSVYEQKVELDEYNKIKIPSDKIDLLKEGTYFINFNSGRIKMTAKFVKIRN